MSEPYRCEDTGAHSSHELAGTTKWCAGVEARREPVTLPPVHEWFVEYAIFAGTLTKFHTERVVSLNEAVAMAKAPETAYAFRFYTMPAPPHPVLLSYTVTPNRIDWAGWYYINATTFSREKIEDMDAADPGAFYLMLRDYPDAKVYVQCRFGNWQIFEGVDRIWLDPQPNYGGAETESV